MSTDQLGFPSDGMQPVPKRKMSKTAKVLIILGLVFGGFMVICCGGVIWTAYSFSNMLSRDPATVVAVGSDIADMDIADGLDPLASIDFKLPIYGRLMTEAVYEDQESASRLRLVGGREGLGPQDLAQIQRATDDALRQQGIVDQETILVEDAYEKEIDVRGHAAQFTIHKGKGEQSGKPRIEVTGTFEGKTGTAELTINVDAEKYPEETIIKMLESIK